MPCLLLIRDNPRNPWCYTDGDQSTSEGATAVVFNDHGWARMGADARTDLLRSRFL